MDISVTRFRAQCLEWIRQVESGGEVVEITPPAGGISPSQRPWEKLRGSGVLAIEPEDSVLADRDFDALR